MGGKKTLSLRAYLSCDKKKNYITNSSDVPRTRRDKRCKHRILVMKTWEKKNNKNYVDIKRRRVLRD